MFKPGQKVVYIEQPNTPPSGTIVTIDGPCPICPNSYEIVEYPCAKNGRPQSFHKNCLRPLEDWETEDISELTEILEDATAYTA